MTIEETAALLGLDRRSVSRAIAAGELPGLRLGRRVLVPVPALRALLATSDSLDRAA